MKKNLVLIVIVAFGFLLRMYRLEYHSLWADELATWNDCWQPSFRDFWQTFSRSELTPPHYFFFEFFFSRFFDASEWSLRFPSVLAGTGFIVTIYLFGIELGGRRTGLIAAALAATSYRGISLSQDARSYSLLFFLVALSGWAWLRWQKSQSAKPYALAAVALAYTHYFGALLVFSQGLTFLFRRPVKLVAWIKIYGCIAVAFIPWMIFLLTHPIPQTSMIQGPPPLNEIFVAHRELFGGSSLNSSLALILGFFGIWAAAGPEKFRRISVLAWVFLPFFVAWLISQKQPIYSSRYYMVALPAMLVAAAVGLSELSRWGRRAPWVGTFIFCLLGLHETIVAREHFTKPRAEQVREATAASIEFLKQFPDAGYVLGDIDPIGARFYREKLGAPKDFDAVFFKKADELTRFEKWPESIKNKDKLVVLIVTYRNLNDIFQNLPTGYEVTERRDFNLASAVLISRKPPGHSDNSASSSRR